MEFQSCRYWFFFGRYVAPFTTRLKSQYSSIQLVSNIELFLCTAKLFSYVRNVIKIHPPAEGTRPVLPSDDDDDRNQYISLGISV